SDLAKVTQAVFAPEPAGARESEAPATRATAMAAPAIAAPAAAAAAAAPETTPAAESPVPARPAGFIEALPGEDGTEAVIHKRPDGSFGVNLLDTDAGQNAPVSITAPTLEVARKTARRLVAKPGAAPAPTEPTEKPPAAAQSEPEPAPPAKVEGQGRYFRKGNTAEAVQ